MVNVTDKAKLNEWLKTRPKSIELQIAARATFSNIIHRYWSLTQESSPLGKQPSNRPTLIDGRLVLGEQPLDQDLENALAVVKLVEVREKIQELVNDLKIRDNINLDPVEYIQRTVDIISDDTPDPVNLFRLIRREAVLIELFPTLKEQWPDSLTSQYRSVFEQFSSALSMFSDRRTIAQQSMMMELQEQDLHPAIVNVAKRTFSLFHLSLIPPRENFIAARTMSREQCLRHALSKPFEFISTDGSVIHWLPGESVDECIFGILTNKSLFKTNEPPNWTDHKINSDDAQGTYVLLDPTHHNEGQKLALENTPSGKPAISPQKFIGEINTIIKKLYIIYFEPIFDDTYFWDFAQKQDMVLHSIKFDFVVPNMFGANSSLEEDLRNINSQTGAERVIIKLKGDNGVFVDSEKIRNAVNYAKQGAGTIKAKAQNGDTYSSSQKPITTEVALANKETQSVLDYFRFLKGKILSHEKTSATVGDDITRDRPPVV